MPVARDNPVRAQIVGDRKRYLVAIAMLALDVVWLTTMGDRLYRPVLGDWMRTKVSLAPAAAFFCCARGNRQARGIRCAAGPAEGQEMLAGALAMTPASLRNIS